MALATLWALAVFAFAQPVPVGRSQEIKDVFLPGSELRVRKADGSKDPLVLRIVDVFPHGTAGFRYHFSWMPLEAGTYNLADYLERVDGSEKGELPPIPAEASAVLPPGPPRFLTAPPPVEPGFVGWYRKLFPWGVALWAALGVGGFARWFLKRRREALRRAAESPENLSLAQRLRPLLELALTRPLETREKAELERLLLSHGRERLGLQTAADPAVWRALRADPATSLWLNTLEGWLHRPASSAPSAEELRDLLAAIRASGS